MTIEVPPRGARSTARLLRYVFAPMARIQISRYRRATSPEQRRTFGFPAWLHNLARHPDQVWVQVGNRTLRVTGESLLGAAREEALRRIYASAPRYAGYQSKTDREIPVLRLTRAGDPG